MGPLDKFILKEDALSTSNEGFQLRFQSHWYRSLPMSCFDFKLEINEKAIDNENLMIEVNHQTFAYSKLKDLDSEYLFILERAIIKGKLDKSLQIGQTCSVRFTLDLYIPYILVGPESKPLLASTIVTKTLICQ